MKTLLNNTKTPEIQKRKPYSRPLVEIVRLVPDQAVLSNCKFGVTFGSGDFGCAPAGPGCVTLAS